MKENTRKRRLNTWVVTVLSLALVLAVGAIAWLQLGSYEEGVLDVYANQQDGYVQLVLDQINLNQHRNSEQIINDILGTLDASNTRYWTFSRQDSLIFVRDVLETSRYKGFTEATYFHSDSAREFLSALRPNHVIHNTILIQNTPYVASGVEFTYGGENYKICLLTNAETVLDYNAYLNAKINLIVLALVLLGIVVVSLITLALLGEHYRKQLWLEMDSNLALRQKIEALDQKIKWGDLYDPECTAFKSGAVPIILKKLEARQAWPLSVYRFRTGRPAREVLRFAGPVEERVLWVLDGEHTLILFRLGSEATEHPLAGIEDADLLGVLHVPEKPEGSLEQSYQEFLRGSKEYGRKAAEEVCV